MNRFYDEIMELHESEDIKRIIRGWENFSHNKARFAPDVPVVLPDMLWITGSGYGTTNLLRLLSEYLYEEQIMEFYGDVKFFEFELEYCGRESRFEPFELFCDAERKASGFRNEYKGIVCINIDGWKKHLNEKHFLNFLEYLSLRSDSWHIIFTVSNADEDKISEIESVLSVYFRIEKAVFSLPATEDLYVYMENRLAKYGFGVHQFAKKILIETVEELRKSKYFDGYKTLNMICSDLVYSAFSADDFEGYTITEAIAGNYSKRSDFVKKTMANIERRKKIGFGISGGETDV